MALYIIDTHALVFFLADSSSLGKTVDAVLENPESSLILPAIALAEALWIASSRKSDISIKQVMQAIDGDARVQVYPLDREVVELAHTLTGIPEMHDRQIVATTLLFARHDPNVVLLTKDQAIVNSRVVKTAWWDSQPSELRVDSSHCLNSGSR